MSGIDLVLNARLSRRDLAVIVMTAFPTPDAHRLNQGPFTGFLEKPFEFERLLELVDRALATPKVGFSGAISVSTLPDIVQLYALSKASGRLSIKHHTGDGEVFFEDGAIVHASTRDATAEDAFYQIMMWSGGEFSMRAGVEPSRRSIRLNWQELIMESCRRLDERLRYRVPSRAGWKVAALIPGAPAADAFENELDEAFQDFGPAAAQAAAPAPEETKPTVEVTMNIKDGLAKLNQLDGFIGACLVDSESGMLLGQEGGAGLNLEIAAAGNTEVVRAKRKTMTNLALKDNIEDILISLAKQYHLIRPLRTRPTLFFYVALDRSRSNLAMARIALADVEKDLQV
jgi:hypothetical protein